MGLAENILKGDIQAAARLITLIENEDADAVNEMESLYPHIGGAYIIGVTGAPGVGKSTLTDGLIDYFRRKNMTVGVIAIDPTSALTGGALLGDRIRMQRHTTDEQVFIRSLATRGWMGGLAKATISVEHIMDAMGKNIIMVETVGSGQVEIDIVKAADTTLLVLSPDAGDEIQTMKAGIIESADVFAVNKADKEGAARFKTDLEMVLSMKPREAKDWVPPVVLTEAVNGKGITELGDALLRHYEFLKTGRTLPLRRRERAKLELMDTIDADIENIISKLDNGTFLKRLVDGLQKGKDTPKNAARAIIDRLSEEG